MFVVGGFKLGPRSVSAVYVRVYLRANISPTRRKTAPSDRDRLWNAPLALVTDNALYAG
jgi:hypothetical protein